MDPLIIPQPKYTPECLMYDSCLTSCLNLIPLRRNTSRIFDAYLRTITDMESGLITRVLGQIINDKYVVLARVRHPHVQLSNQTSVSYKGAFLLRQSKIGFLNPKGIRKRIFSFVTRQINPRSLRSWFVKGTEESTLQLRSFTGMKITTANTISSIIFFVRQIPSTNRC